MLQNYKKKEDKMSLNLSAFFEQNPFESTIFCLLDDVKIEII